MHYQPSYYRSSYLYMSIDVTVTAVLKSGQKVTLTVSGKKPWPAVLDDIRQTYHSAIIDVLFEDESNNNKHESDTDHHTTESLSNLSLYNDDGSFRKDSAKYKHFVLPSTANIHEQSDWDHQLSPTPVLKPLNQLYPTPSSSAKNTKKGQNYDLPLLSILPTDPFDIKHAMLHRLNYQGTLLGHQLLANPCYYKFIYLTRYLTAIRSPILHLPRPLVLEELGHRARSTTSSSSSASPGVESKPSVWNLWGWLVSPSTATPTSSGSGSGSNSSNTLLLRQELESLNIRIQVLEKEKLR